MRYITAQICGVFLLLSILVLVRRSRVLNIRGTRAYRRTLFLSLICLILDMLSVLVVINTAPDFGKLTEYICKAHLISVVVVGVSIFEYLFADQPRDHAKIKLAKTIVMLVALATAIRILAVPIKIHFEGVQGALYTYGDSVMSAYSSIAALAILTFAGSIYLGDRMPKEKASDIRIWTSLIAVSGIAQIFRGDLLIAGFAMSLGAAITFERMESPHRYTDIETGMFNAAAFKSYIIEEYALGRQTYCLRLAINTAHKELTMNEVADLIGFFADAIKKCPGKVFRTNSYTFALVSSNVVSINTAIDRLTTLIREADAGLKIPGIRNTMYAIRTPDLFKTAEEMINFYYKLKTYRPDNDDPVQVINVTQDIIKQISVEEQIRHEITSALEENRVEVYYQPIYDTRTGLFSSAEALVRIRSEKGIIVPPGDIIPVAEDTGLIVPLGERVFTLVCDLLGSDRKPENLKYIEVNLSAVQCRHEALYGTFKDIMEKAGVKPGQINLEITETARLNTTQKTVSVFNRFKNDGVSFSLDDFGTGNSNLDYMTSMPMVSIVKFDHMMTSGYFTNPRIRFAFPYVINMVKDIGLEIVCEGVETREQLETMKALGVEYIQGYHFSKPIPEKEFIEFMELYKDGYKETEEAG